MDGMTTLESEIECTLLFTSSEATSLNIIL